MEWAKAQARAQRWQEEVELLIEEMRRVLEYSDYMAGIWRSRMTQRTVSDKLLQSGIEAYSLKQANSWTARATKFAKLWHTALRAHGKPIDWPTHYIEAGLSAVVTSKKKPFLGRLLAVETPSSHVEPPNV